MKVTLSKAIMKVLGVARVLGLRKKTQIVREEIYEREISEEEAAILMGGALLK